MGKDLGTASCSFWPFPELAALFPELGLLLAALLAGAASRAPLGPGWKNNPRLPRREGRWRSMCGAWKDTVFFSKYTLGSAQQNREMNEIQT